MQPATHSLKSTSTKRINEHLTNKAEDSSDQLPKPRYFQVHFEHLHETNYQLNNELAQLKVTIAQLDEKLGYLLALLSRSPDPIR